MKNEDTNICHLNCDKGYKAEGEAFIECGFSDKKYDEDVQRWLPDPEKSGCVPEVGADYADFSVCSPPKKLPLGDWKLSSDSSSALLTCPHGFVTPEEVSSIKKKKIFCKRNPRFVWLLAVPHTPKTVFLKVRCHCSHNSWCCGASAGLGCVPECPEQPPEVKLL